MQHTLICHRCGKVFTANGPQAKFCDSCKKIVKTNQDREAWERRKIKKRNSGEAKQKYLAEKKLDKSLQCELHIPPYMYPEWKMANKQYFRKRLNQLFTAS